MKIKRRIDEIMRRGDAGEMIKFVEAIQRKAFRDGQRSELYREYETERKSLYTYEQWQKIKENQREHSLKY